MADLHSFREELRELVRKFEKDKDHYLQKGYPEANFGVPLLYFFGNAHKH